MLRGFLSNHVFANLTFAVVLVVGFLSYQLLPKQQDPEMNFNWIAIETPFPGASAEDVEKLVTDPLEEAIKKIADTRFISSTSQSGHSSILVRFHEIPERAFDKRIIDLRREIRNKEKELPEETEDPFVFEVTSSNGFPTAMVVVQGEADDENLRRQARFVREDLERIKGVDGVQKTGLHDPEIHVRFRPQELHGLGVTPIQLADTVATRFKDLSGGSIQMEGEAWLVRFQGTTPDPEEIAQWPIATAAGEIPLGRVAEVVRARKKAEKLTRFNGKPAVLFALTKQANTNILKLTDKIRAYVERRQALRAATGVNVAMVNDQTHMTRNALKVMENNAAVGLLLVMLVTWVFMGSRIALLIGIGIPFCLAGTFGLILAVGGTVNVMVLLGVVISLGMLVDDAVVVVEAIHMRMERGMQAMDAGIAALHEVFAPVTASVLTTMAAFLPLVLLPGILGTFMRTIPLVVSAALALSLVEAYWMLPAHVDATGADKARKTFMTRFRLRLTRRIRTLYIRALAKVLRWPKLSLALAALPFSAAVAIVAAGLVRFEFFAMDPIPLFYVNVEMAPGARLENTMDATVAAEKEVTKRLRPGEALAVASYAGFMFTETAPMAGERFGQVLVSLESDRNIRERTVHEIVEAMRADVTAIAGPINVSFLKLSGGPPTTRPISVKVRGETFDQIRPAVTTLKKILADMPAVTDVADNDAAGGRELVIRPESDAVRRAGLTPVHIKRLSRLLADGEVVSSIQDKGEKVEVRVLARPDAFSGPDQFFNAPVVLPTGETALLGELTTHEIRRGLQGIRHWDYRRAITVEADLDKTQMDEVTANDAIKAAWEEVQERHPGVDLDFSGSLDDITESMDAIATLFLFGIGVMYMILGTQFRSYFQPFMILLTVPMAFTGVVFGLLLSGHPLSLYTLYGVVALSGIAVNSSIVLISAANQRKKAGMTVLHAIVFAARRRVAPIIITSLTTIAGLSSLALGLGGHSLMWGPVATSIVWGLGFSTMLTLFMIPLLYWTFMRRGELREKKDRSTR